MKRAFGSYSGFSSPRRAQEPTVRIAGSETVLIPGKRRIPNVRKSGRVKGYLIRRKNICRSCAALCFWARWGQPGLSGEDQTWTQSQMVSATLGSCAGSHKQNFIITWTGESWEAWPTWARSGWQYSAKVKGFAVVAPQHVCHWGPLFWSVLAVFHTLYKLSCDSLYHHPGNILCLSLCSVSCFQYPMSFSWFPLIFTRP